MKLFLRYMSDLRYKELIQAELELIGEKHEISDLEDNDLLIATDVKYQILRRALTKYYGKKSNTLRGILFARLKNMVYDRVGNHSNGPPYTK